MADLPCPCCEARCHQSQIMQAMITHTAALSVNHGGHFTRIIPRSAVTSGS